LRGNGSRKAKKVQHQTDGYPFQPRTGHLSQGFPAVSIPCIITEELEVTPGEGFYTCGGICG
jgi:hypothetical protein